MSEPISLCEWRKKLEDALKSDAQSTQNTASGEPGETLTEPEMEFVGRLFSVLLKAKLEPFTTKSDFARMTATEIGLLASEGLLSTKVHEGTYGNRWLITADGIDWMEEVDNAFAPRH